MSKNVKLASRELKKAMRESFGDPTRIVDTPAGHETTNTSKMVQGRDSVHIRVRERPGKHIFLATTRCLARIGSFACAGGMIELHTPRNADAS